MNRRDPNFYNGYASRDGPPAHPDILRGRVCALSPGLGPFGHVFPDQSPYKNDGLYVSSGAGEVQQINGGRYSAALHGAAYSIKIQDGKLDFTNGFAMSIWFAPDGSTDAFLMVKYEASSGYIGVRRTGGNSWAFYLERVGFSYYTLSFTYTHAQAVWAHLVVQHDPNVGGQVYVNGTLAASNSSTGTIKNPNDNMWIGSDRGSVRFFSGWVDDMAFYNRPLRSDEIAVLGRYRGRAWEIADYQLAASIVPQQASYLPLLGVG